MSDLWAVVPAAGTGVRLGADIPKQYLTLAGLPMIEHTLRALLANDQIRAVVVAVDPADTLIDTLPSATDRRVIIVHGGQERSHSVLAALDTVAELGKSGDWVLVHDAARPCLPRSALDRLIAAARSSNTGSILVSPVDDTLKQVNAEGEVIATVDREAMRRAQTPQMFPLGVLRASIAEALAAHYSVTDEASAMEFAGHPVATVPGPRCNIKVTVAEDVALAEWYLTTTERGLQ
ncbi:2-C-methyl-D-erythritol 4-phosphate cytidylyltransferase [Luminiphilus syltensis]|uniref:2-C-methyl-D-erythritol 4-phosphate cytidylyltransferase n=1 Tax=Luminiphilus syltensis TaxID=1341119 RepID=UPI0002E4DE5F|nr:2-C-methyl-D-erythritol 4-phosphate cytidylyltransferase [Luminiphilus syltensis]